MSRPEQLKIPVRIHTGRVSDWVLVKESDDVFKGNHPSGYNEGVVLSNITEYDIPTVGERPYFISYDRWFVTSEVTEILSETEHEIVFKTLNSTYKLFNKTMENNQEELLKRFKELFELSQEHRVLSKENLSPEYDRDTFLAGFYKGQAFAYLTAYENLSGEKYFKEDNYDKSK